MAWTNPRTWVTGETVTAAQLNTHLRDNMDYAAEQDTDTVNDVDAAGDIEVILDRVGQVVTGYFVVSGNGGGSLTSAAKSYASLIPAGFRPVRTLFFPALLIDGSTVQDNHAAFAIYASGTVWKSNIVHTIGAGDEMRSTLSWRIA